MFRARRYFEPLTQSDAKRTTNICARSQNQLRLQQKVLENHIFTEFGQATIIVTLSIITSQQSATHPYSKFLMLNQCRRVS